jgi:predicted DNA-binding transcriptional regulator AlpA
MAEPQAIPNPSTHPTLDVPSAAALLGCSPWTAYELIKRGEFPVSVLALGRKIRVPTAPLLDLLGLHPEGS